MDKNEILKKSREAKEDEGVAYTEDRGRRYGVIGFCSVFIVIMLFNLFTGQNNFVPYSMFFAYMAAEAYGKYRLTKGKSLMATTVLGAIASVCFLACHILEVLHIGQ
ncbi:MAG: DUF6442 family protein [Oscillibacter sp.]|jgi:hypothetical protein|nr:DUF6442 family protein [Oscillibacter sp.]